MGKGTYPSSWGGTDSQQREASGSSTNTGTVKKTSRGWVSGSGKADAPGTSDSILRSHGVSEADIKAGGSESWRKGSDAYRANLTDAQRLGYADLPGEAQQKMIQAGVLTPEGQRKEIIGHYYDPRSKSYKFAAANEQPSIFKPLEIAEPPKSISGKESDKLKIYGTPYMPGGYPSPYTASPVSGTIYTPSGFEKVGVKPLSSFDKWYGAQKTKLGLGGAREAQKYQEAVKEYDFVKFTGDKTRIKAQEDILQSKYAEYELAKGISPLAGKGIKTESTFGAFAHKTAEKIRADKPTYGGWQGELSRTINEAIAANVEFGGSVPSLVRHGIPAIVKQPSLLPTLGIVAGGSMIESFRDDPIQTVATMAVTGTVVKGGVKAGGKVGKISSQYRPRYVSKDGVTGLRTGKGDFKVLYEKSSGSYMLESPTKIKSGKIKHDPTQIIDTPQIKYSPKTELPVKIRKLSREEIKIRKEVQASDLRAKQMREGAPIHKITPKELKIREEVRASDLRAKQMREGAPIHKMSPKELKIRGEVKASDLRAKQMRESEILTFRARKLTSREMRQKRDVALSDTHAKTLRKAERVRHDMMTEYQRKRDIWRDESASVYMPSPLQVKSPSTRVYGKAKTYASDIQKTTFTVKPRIRSASRVMKVSGQLSVIAPVRNFPIVEESISKQRTDEKLKSIEKEKQRQKIKMMVGQMSTTSQAQTQIQNQIQVPKLQTPVKQKPHPKTVTPKETSITKIQPTIIEKIPKIPLPKTYPKKKHPSKKKSKKAVAYQVKNPIADIETVMKKVSGM